MHRSPTDRPAATSLQRLIKKARETVSRNQVRSSTDRLGGFSTPTRIGCFALAQNWCLPSAGPGRSRWQRVFIFEAYGFEVDRETLWCGSQQRRQRGSALRETAATI